jgi:hypothetical protein
MKVVMEVQNDEKSSQLTGNVHIKIKMKQHPNDSTQP